MKKNFIKENAPLLALMLATAVGISVAAVIFRQQFWRILPLYVSLAVALMQSRMMRAANLLGGINSVLYAVVLAGYSLYGSAAQSLFISFPMQIATFILWSKKPWGQATVFKRMSAKLRVITVFAGVAAIAALAFALKRGGGEHVILDSSVTVIGLIGPLLMMLSYMEYAPVTALGAAAALALYISMLPEHPEQTTYVVFAVYSVICTTAAAVRIRKLFAEQQKELAHR